MEEKKLTQEELFAAEAYFNLASMIGRCLQSAVYLLDHPEVKPRVITFDSGSEEEGPTIKEPETPDSSEQLPPPSFIERIQSGETDIDSQVEQLCCLYDPRIREIVGPSAIYDMFHLASSIFSYEFTSPEEEPTPEDKKKIAVAWVITKRAFAVNHQDEAIHFLNLPDVLAGELVYTSPLEGRLFDDRDRQFVEAACKLCSDIVFSKVSPDEALREITEIQSSGNIVLLQSKVARNMLAIARGKGVANIDVGKDNHPVKVKATITGRNGEKTVELTRVDYDVMEAVGQIVQENGKGIIITPSQIFHKMSGSDPSQRVSDQIIEEIVASMDKLLFTPATLDFTEQIEQNTKLKAKRDKGELKGAIEGNLISGLHLKEYSASYKGQTAKHSFLIYDMPMLYYYSMTIHHLATVPSYLLSGSKPKAAQKKAQKPEAPRQRLTLKELGLQRYLLERIEYFKKLKKKQAEKDWRKKVYKNDYDFQISFDTIAADIEYETTEKKKRMLREQTYEFLQNQVALKNIKRCEYYYKGKALSGVTITL